MNEESKCPRCGEDGPHYVPPSLGEDGFYLCDEAVQRDEKLREDIEEWLNSYSFCLKGTPKFLKGPMYELAKIIRGES